MDLSKRWKITGVVSKEADLRATREVDRKEGGEFYSFPPMAKPTHNLVI